MLRSKEPHGTVSGCALVESHRVVASSGLAEFGDDCVREVMAIAVGGERRSYDRVVVHSKFPRVQEAFQQFGALTDTHLVDTSQNAIQLHDGDQAEVSRVGLG